MTAGLTGEQLVRYYGWSSNVLRTLANLLGVRVSFLIGGTSSDCDIETALYQEALAIFLKDHVVSETLEIRLRKLARKGAGNTWLTRSRPANI